MLLRSSADVREGANAHNSVRVLLERIKQLQIIL